MTNVLTQMSQVIPKNTSFESSNNSSGKNTLDNQGANITDKDFQSTYNETEPDIPRLEIEEEVTKAVFVSAKNITTINNSINNLDIDSTTSIENTVLGLETDFVSKDKIVIPSAININTIEAVSREQPTSKERNVNSSENDLSVLSSIVSNLEEIDTTKEYSGSDQSYDTQTPTDTSLKNTDSTFNEKTTVNNITAMMLEQQNTHSSVLADTIVEAQISSATSFTPKIIKPTTAEVNVKIPTSMPLTNDVDTLPTPVPTSRELLPQNVAIADVKKSQSQSQSQSQTATKALDFVQGNLNTPSFNNRIVDSETQSKPAPLSGFISSDGITIMPQNTTATGSGPLTTSMPAIAHVVVPTSTPLPLVDTSTITSSSIHQQPLTQAFIEQHAPQVVSQVVNRIAKIDGEQKVTLRLDPPELGKVDIDMKFTDRGVTIVVQAERSEAVDLMRRNANELLRELRQSGLTLSSSDMTFSQQKDSQDNQSSKAGLAQPEDESASLNIQTTYTLKPVPTMTNTIDDRLDLRL